MSEGFMDESKWVLDDIVLHAYMLIAAFDEGDTEPEEVMPLLTERLIGFAADGFEDPIPRRQLTNAIARLCEHGFLQPIGPNIVKLTVKGQARLHEQLRAADAEGSPQPPEFKSDIEARLALSEPTDDERLSFLMATLVGCWHFEHATGHPAPQDTLLAVSNAETGVPLDPVFASAALEALCAVGHLERLVLEGAVVFALTPQGRRMAQDAYGAEKPDLEAWTKLQVEGIERGNARLTKLRRQWREDK